jgi:hypothetical protein
MSITEPRVKATVMDADQRHKGGRPPLLGTPLRFILSWAALIAAGGSAKPSHARDKP